MWIFSTKGFFSVVENKDDRNRVIIRARLRKDIDDLKYIFDSLKLRTTKIAINSRSDYHYRFTADRMDWITVMIRLMVGIHYTNFKDAVFDTESGEMKEKRQDAYLKIWAIMCNLQGCEADSTKERSTLKKEKWQNSNEF